MGKAVHMLDGNARHSWRQPTAEDLLGGAVTFML
jgi:hypothetical protein